jgi:hypothetical protein
MRLLWRVGEIIGAVSLGVWAILKIASNVSGIAIMIDDPDQSLKAINRGLAWLFSTPWWVPTLLAAIAMALIFWSTLTEIFEYTTNHRPLRARAQKHEDHRRQIRMSVALLGMIVFGAGFFACAAWWYALERRPATTAKLEIAPEASPSVVAAPQAPIPSDAALPITGPSKVVEAPAPTGHPPPTAPFRQPGRNYVDAHVTPEFLVGLYDGNTKLRADTLVSEQIGKWVLVSGPVGEIHSSTKDFALVVFASRKKPSIYMWFSGEWIDRLASLPKNKQISVVGQLKKVTDYSATVELENCELLDTDPATNAPHGG